MSTQKPTNELFEPRMASKAATELITAPSLTFFQDAKRRLFKNKAAVISLFVLVLIGLIAIVSFWLTTNDPNAQNVTWKNLPPRIASLNLPLFDGTRNGVDAYKAAGVPNHVTYIFGTDSFGRDLFARVLVGTRVSLLIALLATLFDLFIGVIFGLFSGWKGGRIDSLMQRFIEIISSVPTLVIAILMLLVFKPGLTSIIFAIGLSGWVTMARLVRAETLKLKEQEYILAARTLGEKSSTIARKHLLPNLSSTIIIQTMFTIPTAIFFEAFLSYIGIGIPAPTASLGTLLSEGQKSLQLYPSELVFPAIVMVALMLSFNLLADGLRDAFDPKTKD